MSDFVPYIVFGVVGLVVALYAIAARNDRLARDEDLASLAADWGAELIRTPSRDAIPALSTLPYFNAGARIARAVTRSLDGLDVTVAEVRVPTRSGGNSTNVTHNTTVVFCELEAPKFRAGPAPKGMAAMAPAMDALPGLRKLSEVRLGPRVEVPALPGFDDRFYLSGEPAAAACVNDDFVRMLELGDGRIVEATGRHVFLYRPSELTALDELPASTEALATWARRVNA